MNIAPTLLIAFALMSQPAEAKKSARQEKVTAQPETLIEQRTQKVLAQLKSRPLRLLGESAALATDSIRAEATKAGFLTALYNRKLVEASWPSEMLADKRIFAEVLSRELGQEKALVYYPKTLGLREFLIRNGFLDREGALRKDQAEAIEAALYREFPAGFVARPAVGVAPHETTKGLFNDTDSFMVELFRDGTSLYRKEHSQSAVSAHLLGGAIASGEAVVLQENLTAEADAKAPLKRKFFQEVRIHTYEGLVISGARPERWVQRELLESAQTEQAEKFVQVFLKELPTSLVVRQAWGVDVAVFDNGEMKINDIVTNRGLKGAWSSYLEQPRVIEAYARHLEAISNLRFEGVSGWLILHGFANYFPFWEKRIEKARGFSKILAYFPPWP